MNGTLFHGVKSTEIQRLKEIPEHIQVKTDMISAGDSQEHLLRYTPHPRRREKNPLIGETGLTRSSVHLTELSDPVNREEIVTYAWNEYSMSRLSFGYTFTPSAPNSFPSSPSIILLPLQLGLKPRHFRALADTAEGRRLGTRSIFISVTLLKPSLTLRNCCYF